MNVRDARDLGDLFLKFLRDGKVAGPVNAYNLDIDRGGQAKVEDLAGDVRRLEIEGALREARGQLAPQLGDIVRRRLVLRFQGHQDFPVGVADRAVVDVGHNGERLGQPHDVKDQGPLTVGNDLADSV